MYKGRYTLAVAVILTLFLAACGGTTVVGLVESVEVRGDSLRLPVGSTSTLEAVVEVSGPVSDEVEWSSSDSSVATVDAAGRVTAVAAGTAHIGATSVVQPDVTGSVTVTVLESPTDAGALTGFSVEGADLVVFQGETETRVRYYDSEGLALPQSAAGVIRASAPGSVGVVGSGYAPSSHIDVWFTPSATLLGSALVTETGDLSARFDLPAELSSGAYNLVVEAIDDLGEATSLRLAVEIESEQAVREFAHCPAASDWFVSSISGSATAAGTSIVAPLETIQAAVDAAVPNDVVCVAAGEYEVDNRPADGETPGAAETHVLVSIDKPITLVGPNAGIPGNEARSPEAELVVSGALVDTLYAVRIHADDVTIDGFRIATKSPMQDPYPNGVYGVHASPMATRNVAVINNILSDVNYPIWVNRGRSEVAATGFVIEDNLIVGPQASNDMAILMQGAFGTVRNNVIRDARVGIQVQPYQLVGSGLVEDNSIEAFQTGLWFNYQENSGSYWSFEENVVLGTASPLGWPLYTTDPSAWSGIRVETFYEGAVVFLGNSVTSGEANPPVDGAVYLLRLKSVRNGIVSGLGTDADVGAFFRLNEFTDYAPTGVTTEDLSLEDGLLQLRLR